jgi:hypothetical protein
VEFWLPGRQKDVLMYRIEVAPGEEAVFRTIEELAVAIRNGVVTPRARIYHHASQKWLPIGLHPHYKKALDMPAAGISPPPVTSATPIPTPSAPRQHLAARPLAPHPQPERVPPLRPAPEPSPAPSAYAAPRIPAPVHSPVIAMQNEVLRDLPVVSIPEPLPWTVPSAPTTVVTRDAFEPSMHAPEVYAPPTHTPTSVPTHTPVSQERDSRSSAGVHSRPELAGRVEEHPAFHDDELLPRPTARRSRRLGGGPVMLLGAAVALVIGTQLVVTSTTRSSADPPPALAKSDESAKGSSNPAAPAAERPTTVTSSGETGRSEEPLVTIAPARVAMTPGPAFAGSVPARPGDSTSAPKRPPSVAAVPAPTPTTIAPAPLAIELALPDLSTDSVGRSTGTKDTLGMKNILRALNGTNAAGAPPAP